MDREILECKSTISYLVSKAIDGRLTEYEGKVLNTISVLAYSLLSHERDLSNAIFKVSYSMKK